MTKILLAEDDVNLREIFEMRLKSEGYEVVTAGDGEEALVVATRERPDLMVVDVMMPKISGFEMLETLRANPQTANIKAIMMTALGQAEDRERGQKLGVLKYLVKSQVTLEDFVRSIHEILDQKQTSNPERSNMDPNSNQPQDQQIPQTPAPEPSLPPTAEPTNVPVDDGNMAAPAAAESTEQEKSEVQGQIDNFASGGTPMPSAPPAPEAGVDTGGMPAPAADVAAPSEPTAPAEPTPAPSADPMTGSTDEATTTSMPPAGAPADDHSAAPGSMVEPTNMSDQPQQ